MRVFFSRDSARYGLTVIFRAISTASRDENLVLRGLREGQPAPVIIPFDLTEDEAKLRFESYQKSRWFAPSGLLNKEGVSIQSAFFPFWCFEATISLDYSAKSGFDTPHGKIAWHEEKLEGALHDIRYSTESELMQVYASFKFRRDLVEGLKSKKGVVPSSLSGRPMERFEAVSRKVKCKGFHSEIQSPDLRQGLGWELVLRSIRKHQEGLIEKRVKSETGAHHVKDMRIQLRVLDRKVRMVYRPGFILDYCFNESHADNGEIIPERFLSVMSGAFDGGIRGERHFCPKKAQLAVTGVGGSLGLATAALGDVALGMESLSTYGVETCFWTFMAASAAGFFARFSSKADRRNHDIEMARAEELFFKEYSASGVGLGQTFDEYQDWIRCDSEWRHWEESGKWDWEEAKRKRWAERLWKSQHKRRRQNQALMEDMEMERIARAMDGKREARRRAKWGESDRARAFAEAQSEWGRRTKAERDFLGFYAILGLEPAGEMTGDDIKRAFRKAAMKWHPDRRLSDSDTTDSEQIRNKFQTLQRAYEVLRDPALKRLYDRGESIEL
ncbi:hypothetical protein BSKO_10286 [Bryopsis sp. KO-2023]|nr:hypothetical protein BSKO_10286 [Bryopsis sp. KO-2023]